MSRLYCVFIFTAIVFLSSAGIAGPPFTTDDPQPVDFRHWEFYLASQQEYDPSNEVNATLPHVEVNYGALPNLQLHIVAPMAFVRGNGQTQYGFGTTELGIKYRFVAETENVPQVGVFPLVEFPTGSREKGLSTGETQVFLPVWLQKSWGKLTTYGGGGFWYNPGAQMRNFTLTGWEVQYDFSTTLTLGCEAYYHTADAVDADAQARFGIGGYFNVDEHNHLLFSVGRSFIGETSSTGYLGYQFTI